MSAILEGSRLVGVEWLESIRNGVNTVAALSTKADRHKVAIQLKAEISDAIESAPQPPDHVGDANKMVQMPGAILKGWRHMPTLGEALQENQRLTSLLTEQKRIYDEEIGRLVSKRTAQDAEFAGLQASVSTLSRLVDDMRALLVDVERECSSDGFGGQFEDGESKIIDRVRAMLAMLAAPQPTKRDPLTDEQIDAAVDVWFASASERGTDRPFRERMRLALQRANVLGAAPTSDSPQSNCADSKQMDWLRKLFSDALSWGMIYGPHMSWDEWERRKKEAAEKYVQMVPHPMRPFESPEELLRVLEGGDDPDTRPQAMAEIEQLAKVPGAVQSLKNRGLCIWPAVFVTGEFDDARPLSAYVADAMSAWTICTAGLKEGRPPKFVEVMASISIRLGIPGTPDSLSAWAAANPSNQETWGSK